MTRRPRKARGRATWPSSTLGCSRRQSRLQTAKDAPSSRPHYENGQRGVSIMRLYAGNGRTLWRAVVALWGSTRTHRRAPGDRPMTRRRPRGPLVAARSYLHSPLKRREQDKTKKKKKRRTFEVGPWPFAHVPPIPLIILCILLVARLSPYWAPFASMRRERRQQPGRVVALDLDPVLRDADACQRQIKRDIRGRRTSRTCHSTPT